MGFVVQIGFDNPNSEKSFYEPGYKRGKRWERGGERFRFVGGGG